VQARPYPPPRCPIGPARSPSRHTPDRTASLILTITRRQHLLSRPYSSYLPFLILVAQPHQHRQNCFLHATKCCWRGISSRREPVNCTTTSTCACIPSLSATTQYCVSFGEHVSSDGSGVTFNCACVASNTPSITFHSARLVSRAVCRACAAASDFWQCRSPAGTGPLTTSRAGTYEVPNCLRALPP
jgi:hypothetical protein